MCNNSLAAVLLWNFVICSHREHNKRTGQQPDERARYTRGVFTLKSARRTRLEKTRKNEKKKKPSEQGRCVSKERSARAAARGTRNEMEYMYIRGARTHEGGRSSAAATAKGPSGGSPPPFSLSLSLPVLLHRILKLSLSFFNTLSFPHSPDVSLSLSLALSVGFRSPRSTRRTVRPFTLPDHTARTPMRDRYSARTAEPSRTSVPAAEAVAAPVPNRSGIHLNSGEGVYAD